MLAREVMAMLRTGDVLVCQTSGLWAAVVRWATRSPWTHVALYAGSGMVIEVSASYPVRVTPLRYRRYAALRAPGLTPEQRRAVVRAALRRRGAGYDWPGILAIALRLLLGFRACWDARRRYICTELVLTAYRAAGIDLAPGCDLLTPAEVLALPTLQRVLEVTDGAAAGAAPRQAARPDPR